MWKNSGDRKNTGLIYFKYKVIGLNQDRFINKLVKADICLHKIKKISNKETTFLIDIKENKKFFAIVKKMCYNNSDFSHDNVISQKKSSKRAKIIKKDGKNSNIVALKKDCGYDIIKVKTCGKGYPLYYLATNLGIFIGIIVFCFNCFFANDLILSLSYSGSGMVLQKQVEEILSENGVEKYKRFSTFDLDDLSNKIVTSSDMISYAELTKRGNQLQIYLVLANSSSSTINDNVYQLISDQKGVVKDIKVYRGNALVKQGDLVEEGMVLVDGNVEHNGTAIKTNVIASALIEVTWQYEYVSDFENQQHLAELFAKIQFEKQNGDRQIQNLSIDCANVGDKYVYSVKIVFEHVLKT